MRFQTKFQNLLSAINACFRFRVTFRVVYMSNIRAVFDTIFRNSKTTSKRRLFFQVRLGRAIKSDILIALKQSKPKVLSAIQPNTQNII